MADLITPTGFGHGVKLNFNRISESSKNISILNRKIMKNYTDICELFSYLFNITWHFQ